MKEENRGSGSAPLQQAVLSRSQRLESEAEVWGAFALFNFKFDVVDVRDNEHQNTCGVERGSAMGEFCLVFILIHAMYRRQLPVQ